jgi:hypothetical protein
MSGNKSITKPQKNGDRNVGFAHTRHQLNPTRKNVILMEDAKDDRNFNEQEGKLHKTITIPSLHQRNLFVAIQFRWKISLRFLT